MSLLEDDPFLSRFFDTPEKKARWVVRLRWLYLLWILFVCAGIFFLMWYGLSNS